MSTLIADSILTEEGAPRVRFAARERRGVILGLSLGQLVVIAAVVAMLLITLFVDVNAIWVMLPIAAIVFFFGVATYRREPILQIIWQAGRYIYRAATKQTQFRRDVWWRVSTASLDIGKAHLEAIRPEPISRFLLPGALGDVHIIQIPGAGAFVYNARGTLASITLQVGSSAWSLRDKGVQRAAYDGFVEWLASLENMPGLVEATCRIRVDRASTNELEEYLATRVDQQSLAVSDELAHDYTDLITAAAKGSMGFTNYVTLTFSTANLNAAIRDGGGGLTGLAAVLKERVAGLEPALARARVSLHGWLTAADLDDLFAAACDPVSAAHRRERESLKHRAPEANQPVMGIDETWNNLRVDQSWHQTFWVAEWPRTDVRTGFLEPLLYAGDATRVITLQVRPVPIHKALNEVNRAQSDMETSAEIRLRLHSRVTLAHLREVEALNSREEDLVDGFGDVKIRGFITVSAETEGALARGRTEIEQASHPSRLVLASMAGQQAAGFVTSALPVPVEGD
ncbi:PrgI family protein [Planctomonas sp. JC2975]|uniref:PrgI family protein n=1 Tax=Planctomonas sp. JC2975 TaxID=2729626 RepID=UPI00147646D9|nr:PrgI family protein [Planctomonas sp. JC2975]NNC12839.1 PrgI family protein [Planctomonas sp. JC2975]